MGVILLYFVYEFHATKKPRKTHQTALDKSTPINSDKNVR